MKYITLFSYLFCLLLLAVSCKKNNNSAEPLKLARSGYVVTDSASISGYWELRVLYGCQMPNCNPYFSAGNGNTWYFKDSTYRHTVVSQAPQYTSSDSAVYIVGRDTCMATGSLMNFFKPKDDPYTRIFFEIKKDTLILYWGVITADGTIQKYVRY